MHLSSIYKNNLIDVCLHQNQCMTKKKKKKMAKAEYIVNHLSFIYN